MSSDAYTPITTSSRLQTPRGHRLYVTTRSEVPVEMPIPNIGDTITSQVGAGSPLASNLIYEIHDSPNGNKKSVSFHHTALPSIPWTTSTRMANPRNHLIYKTTILIPISESFPIPSLGVAISTISYLSGVAAGRQSDIIVSESHPEAYGGYRLEITHMTVPSGEFTEYESIAHTFPPLYPTVGSAYPGGSRPRSRVVPARVVYEYRLDPTTDVGVDPPNWLEDPVIWDYSDPASGPFEILSYMGEANGLNFIAGDGDSGRVGDFLNQSFVAMDTLNDEFFVDAPGDLHFGINASFPSATDYSVWIVDKTEFMASRTIHTWMNILYMRRTVWVKAQ